MLQCPKCGKNIKEFTGKFPITIYTVVTEHKSQLSLRARSIECKAEKAFTQEDIDVTCPMCSTTFPASEIVILASCVYCGKGLDENNYCKYNEVYVCNDCGKRHKYTRELCNFCALKSECRLYKSLVTDGKIKAKVNEIFGGYDE